jgi:flavorubredoxin
MLGATERIARSIIEGISDAGVSVKLFDVASSDRTEVIGEMLDAKGYLFGSSTHNNDMLPGIAGFLEFVKGLKPKNRLAGLFGSYGWSGGAVASMEKIVKESGIDVAILSVSFKYMPDAFDLEKCYNYGKEFAGKL